MEFLFLSTSPFRSVNLLSCQYDMIFGAHSNIFNNKIHIESYGIFLVVHFKNQFLFNPTQIVNMELVKILLVFFIDCDMNKTLEINVVLSFREQLTMDK